MRCLRLIIGALLVVAGLCRTALADDTHYQDFPIGGRAVGLGGAFTALANDPSGVYYNPAGLVDQHRRSVQVSTNLYGLEVADSFFNAVGRVADLDTVFAELNVIPSAAAYSNVIRADDDGEPISGYGLGVFVPSARSLNVQTFSEIADPGALCTTVTYNRSLSDRTFLLGAGHGQRLTPTWSIGAGFYMAYRTFRESEDVACSAGSNRFSTAVTNVNLAVASLLAKIGVKARVGHRWRFGATVSSPSVRVFDVATVSVRRGSALGGDNAPEFFARELSGLSADTRIAPEIRLGGAYIVPRRLTLTIDAIFHAGTTYNLYDLPANETAVRNAITTARRIVRNPIVNINAGFEYLFIKEFSTALGLFSNFSSAEPIEGEVGDTFSRDSLPRIHSAGGSLVLGFFSDYTLTRLGVIVSYGEGSDVVPRTPGLAVLGQPDEFVKVDFNQLFAFVFISSTFRY